MDNRKELQSYQPDFYREFKEMQEILKSQGIVFDDLFLKNLKIRNNFNVLTMDLETTERWEQFLEIAVQSDFSLDDRRKTIYNLLNPDKMSKTFIERIFTQYANYIPEISFVDSQILIKYVESDDVTRNLASIFSILNQRKPVHLALLIATFTLWQQRQVGKGYVNGTITNYKEFVLSDDVVLSEDLRLSDMKGHYNNTKFQNFNN